MINRKGMQNGDNIIVHIVFDEFKNAYIGEYIAVLSSFKLQFKKECPIICIF